MSPPRHRRLLPVTIHNQCLLIDASQVVTVEQGDRVQRNPSGGSLHGWLLGSLDGATVFALASILELGAAPRTDSGSIVVLSRSNGEMWGLMVDQVGSSFEASSDAIHPLDGAMGAATFSALVDIAPDPLLLLASEHLHPDDARAALPVETQPPQPHPDRPIADQTTSPRMLWISIDAERHLHVGLSLKQVVEIREPLPVATLPGPGTNSALTGFVVYDGQALPTASLGQLYGIVEPNGTASRLLIARCTRTARRVGLPIFGETRLVELPITHRVEIPQPEVAVWIRGCFQIDDGALLVPDLDAMLG